MASNVCQVCGHPASKKDPVVTVRDRTVAKNSGLPTKYRRHKSGRDNGRCDATLR